MRYIVDFITARRCA